MLCWESGKRCTFVEFFRKADKKPKPEGENLCKVRLHWMQWKKNGFQVELRNCSKLLTILLEFMRDLLRIRYYASSHEICK